MSKPTPLRASALRPAIVGLCLLLAFASAWAQKRVALVIGNAAYTGQKPLKNPGNDAADVATALRRAGLKTTALTDQGRTEMNRAVDQFLAEAEGADLAVVYYAGHGMQADGDTYLIPVDARINSERDVRTEALRLADLMNDLEARRIRHTLLVLDACRDNPFRTRTRNGARGLAPPKEMNGAFMVAYATAHDRTADDGPGRNGAYTAELLKQLAQPGKNLRDVLEDTQLAVEAASQGAQRPKLYGDTARFRSLVLLPGEGPKPPPQPTTGPSPEQAEQQAWEAAQRAHSTAGYNAFLAEFPNSRFAGAARVARAGLAPAPQPEPAAAPQPQPGQVFKDCSDCPELVVIPAGEFTMGSPAGEVARYRDEGPQHAVQIGYRLAVGRFEVTRGEFARFVQATGYLTEAEQNVRGDKGCAASRGQTKDETTRRSWRDPNFAQTDAHPVVCVSWNDVHAYLNWLNAKAPGRGYRLLTEAEWEYAARAGSSTRFFWGHDVDASAQCAWANGADAAATILSAKHGAGGGDGVGGATQAACNDGAAYTSARARYKANAFGLYDMAGNVSEWVQDVWHDNYSGAPVDGAAWMAAGYSERRVMRGGSWMHVSGNLRSAYRAWNDVSSSTNAGGFRIARPL